MAVAFIYSLQNLWPLSIFKFDDLRASDQIVKKLKVPENTKRFVYAVRDPESESVIYILCVQNLSERSAIDAELLIREIRPEAVVVQVSPSAVSEIQSDEKGLGNNVCEPFPTSPFQVLKRCFTDKINKDKYENVAGTLVLKEVFGVSFYGHVMAAKKVAKEAGSSFLLLETPDALTSSLDNNDNNNSSEVDTGGIGKLHGFVSNLIPHNVGSALSLSSRKFSITNDVQLRMVKALSPYMDLSLKKLGDSSSVSATGAEGIDPGSLYEVPPFAQSFFPLLLDLHNIFVDLPSMGRALASSQKMLYDVSRGETVNAQIISEVYTFRVAVEGLRIALNNAGRLPTWKLDKSKTVFSELPVEDKSSALLAHALQSQTRDFKTVVALVDSSSLFGLRKHWGTSIPIEVKELVGQLVSCYDTDENSKQSEKKSLFSKKPMMAVGAGATAVIGVSSLSKAVPTSTLFKVVTLKLPASLNFMLIQTQRTLAMALSKTLASTKVMAPGLAKSGVNTTVLKATASAEKIRAVVHGVIASAEKTSLSAMRTAFYEIMRKRRIQPVGFLPWATFGCSVATCSGLLMYGDGIECAVESVPVATSIASLGRGIQNLHQASEKVGQTDGTRVQKAIESLMYRLRRAKIQ